MKRISEKRLKKLGGKVPFSTIQNRSPIKKRSRPKAETLRIYGGKKRIEWVKGLPCAACGVVGYSENAHVAPPSEKGTGYKAGYEFIVPLCSNHRPANGHFGCHMALHAWGMEKFRAEFPQFNPEDAARETERAWQQHLENQK